MNKKHYFRFAIFLLLTLFFSTLLSQDKYYNQLIKARTAHYEDVMKILHQMNLECLKNQSELVCFDIFKNALNQYSNRGTIVLYDANQRIIFEKRDESIYDHRIAVKVQEIFDEFPSLQPRLEISKLTSYPNPIGNALNAMTFSAGNYIDDVISRLTGHGPIIRDLTWWEFAQKVAWQRFYPSIPLVLMLVLVALYGFLRQYRVEQLNIRLIKEQQQLTQDKQQLSQSILDLNETLKNKQKQADQLSTHLFDLEHQIHHSVNAHEIEQLNQQKLILEGEIHQNNQHTLSLKQQLQQKDQDQRQLQQRIQEYQLKSGYTLVGEFVRRWNLFEQQLHRVCSQEMRKKIAYNLDTKTKTHKTDTVHLIDDVYNQAFFNQLIYDELFKVRQFRNQLIHGRDEKDYQNLVSDLKRHIGFLDQVISKLQSQQLYDDAA